MLNKKRKLKNSTNPESLKAVGLHCWLGAILIFAKRYNSLDSISYFISNLWFFSRVRSSVIKTNFIKFTRKLFVVWVCVFLPSIVQLPLFARTQVIGENLDSQFLTIKIFNDNVERKSINSVSFLNIVDRIKFNQSGSEGISKFFGGTKKFLITQIQPSSIITNKPANNQTNNSNKNFLFEIVHTIIQNLDFILFIVVFNLIGQTLGYKIHQWLHSKHYFIVRERAKRIKKIRNNRIAWQKRFGKIESKAPNIYISCKNYLIFRMISCRYILLIIFFNFI